jgi:DNA-binding response OmpR family regulator
VAEAPPDLVVLDLTLPGMGGLEVCRRPQARWPIPVVMLTARGEETDRLVRFETGADDYVTKPSSQLDSDAITDGELVVDLSVHEVRISGKLIPLASREYDLLVFLMRNPRQAFTREQLLTEVWGWTFGGAPTVTVHVRRLREKLEPDPTFPKRILTV